MREFCALYEELDGLTATQAKVAALAHWFARTDPHDAAWALHCLLGRQRRRLISGRRLRQICLEGAGLPDWLFDSCYRQVGDTAETIALLWPRCRSTGDLSPPCREPLHHWMEILLPQMAALEGAAQAEALQRLWGELEPLEVLVCGKLLSGALRVGVAEGLVVRSLARLSGLEECLLRHRLMGGFQPGAEAWRALLAPAGRSEPVRSRPYPFFLASPLPAGSPPDGETSQWQVEWKWDGIRGQLIQRGGEVFLWSRREELLNAAFPELVALGLELPPGTVLDGEVLVWRPGEMRPRPFGELQRRLGRRAPGAALLRTLPAAFVAYDLLESEGEDRRGEPLAQRRRRLEHLQHCSGPLAQGCPSLRLSPLLALPGWEELEPLRQQARQAGAEGLMLKALAAPYRSGRRRGTWWKHKLEPLRLDAVLLYAQAGSGRRANLHTDYTFGLWNGEGQLATFAKVYSGLDNGEIVELDRWIRAHTLRRHGPVRVVEPEQVFELAFEGLQASNRHRSGIAVRFPRIARWRRDKPAAEADSLAAARALLEALSPC